MLAAMVLAVFTVFSAGSMTHGFVAYYAASRLLVSGELGPIAYDDRWFGEKVQQITASSVREIFTPNPPTMALMALPVAGLDAQPARAVWLVASLVAFIAAVAALVKYQSLRNRDVSIPVLLVMLLSPAVFTNLRIGQGYLIVFTLSAATALLLIKGHDRAAGVCLGALLSLKMSGLAIVWLLIAKKRWVALGTAAITGAIVVIAITPFIDPRMWIVFPSEVRAFVARPSGSVTAYQTTLEPGAPLVHRRSAVEPGARCKLRGPRLRRTGSCHRPGHAHHDRPGDTIDACRAVDRGRRDADRAVPTGCRRASFRVAGDSARAAAVDTAAAGPTRFPADRSAGIYR